MAYALFVVSLAHLVRFANQIEPFVGVGAKYKLVLHRLAVQLTLVLPPRRPKLAFSATNISQSDREQRPSACRGALSGVQAG